MSTFTENLAVKILSDNLVYHYAGLQNSVQDGNMTEQELNEEMLPEEMIGTADFFLKEAYKKGELVSEYSGVMVEAKHLKFLGTSKLVDVKNQAVTLAVGKLN